MHEAARVILFVKDMKVMQAFYEGILGLEQISNSENSKDFVSLNAGGIQICLHQIPQRYAKNIEITDPPIPREETPMKVAFRVANVEDTRAQLESHEIKMQKVQKGKKVCFCDGIDPEGNIFQISNRP